MGVNLHTLWGWYGPALAGAIVVMLFIGLMAMGPYAEKKEWAEAPTKLNAARDSLVKGISDETWDLLREAYKDNGGDAAVATDAAVRDERHVLARCLTAAHQRLHLRNPEVRGQTR